MIVHVPATLDAEVLVGLAVTAAAQAVIDQITAGPDTTVNSERMLALESQPEFQVAVATLESVLLFGDTSAADVLTAEIDRLLQ